MYTLDSAERVCEGAWRKSSLELYASRGMAPPAHEKRAYLGCKFSFIGP